jgi:glyoxylate utilization-related uncharacterized protein
MSNNETESLYALGQNFNEMTPEEKEEFFAAVGLSSPKVTPELYEFFAFVVSGKVAAVFIANKQNMQDYITAFSSSPTIVKLTAEQKNVVQMDWAHDEQTGEFSQPQ